jgi:hypothetical protein
MVEIRVAVLFTKQTCMVAVIFENVAVSQKIFDVLSDLTGGSIYSCSIGQISPRNRLLQSF